MRTPVVIVGGGGHGGMVAAALQSDGHAIVGFVDPDPAAAIAGLKHLGPDDRLDALDPACYLLALGLGSAADCGPRAAGYAALRARGFGFIEVRHPAAILAGSIKRDSGCQFLPGAIVNEAAVLGENVLINSGAVVEHDCRIGAHSHVASGATLCGGCAVGARVHIGAGATVIQGIEIGDDCLVAAGAVVTRNLAPAERVAGIPARPMEGGK